MNFSISAFLFFLVIIFLLFFIFAYGIPLFISYFKNLLLDESLRMKNTTFGRMARTYGNYHLKKEWRRAMNFRYK